MDSREPDTLQEGYVTEDYQHWICANCFRDFQEQFEWKIAEKGETP
jgi:hypothetical protein